MEAFKIPMSAARDKENEVIDKLEKLYDETKDPLHLVSLEFLRLHLQSQLMEFDSLCQSQQDKGVLPHMVVNQVLKFCGALIVQYAHLYGKGNKNDPFNLMDNVNALEGMLQEHIIDALTAVVEVQLARRSK